MLKLFACTNKIKERKRIKRQMNPLSRQQMDRRPATQSPPLLAAAAAAAAAAVSLALYKQMHLQLWRSHDVHPQGILAAAAAAPAAARAAAAAAAALYRQL